MRIITLEELKALVTPAAAISAVKDGFIAYAKGQIEQPDPMQLLFKEPDGHLAGDCHVKAAQGRGIPYFVIKVAAGFYGNGGLGLDPNSGLVLVMSAETGQPVAVLQDDGWLTQVRTAAAGALAAGIRPRSENATLGIIGTGTQAQLQAQMITQATTHERVLIWGRNEAKATNLADRLSAEGIAATVAKSVRDMCDVAETVVTTTPAMAPILKSDDVQNGLHIIAVGADSPGKLEVDPKLTARASLVVTDSHSQCVHHGDFGAAVRAGLVDESSDLSLGDVLADTDLLPELAGKDISLVDLTGLGVQDLAMGRVIMQQIQT